MKEVLRVREKTLPEHWYFESEICQTYDLVEDLTTILLTIDKVFEEINTTRTIEIGLRLHSVAQKLFSFDPYVKRVFKSEDATVTWRGSTFDNIVHAIEGEARLYLSYFEPFLSEDTVDHIPEDLADALVVLRTQIRLRVAKDGNQKATTPGHKGPTDEEPYLGLQFHDDLTVSRLGDEYRDYRRFVILLSPQQFKILKFIHGAGEKGRTKGEMDAEGFTSLKQEKTKINEKLIPIDLRFEKYEHKLIHSGKDR